MTLYEINEQFRFLDQMAEENPDMDFSDTLESLEMERTEKIENICRYIRNLEAQAEAKKTEADRLKASAQADKNKIDSLKAYLAANMNAAGQKKNTFGVFTVSVRHSSTGSLVLDVPEENLPFDYVTEKISFVADKKKLKAAIESGEDLSAYAHIVPTPDSVSIK